MPGVTLYSTSTDSQGQELQQAIRAAISPEPLRVVSQAGELIEALSRRVAKGVVVLAPSDGEDLGVLYDLSAWLWNSDVLLLLPDSEGGRLASDLRELSPRVVLRRELASEHIANIVSRLLQRSQRRAAAWSSLEAG